MWPAALEGDGENKKLFYV